MFMIEILFPGIFKIEDNFKKNLATLNLTPGIKFYGEDLIKINEKEYRKWDPFRSKIAAAILNGLEHMPISEKNKVLYLGVASGTTCSHISDIVGFQGHIWAVDFAYKPLRDFVYNFARYRRNVSPILEDVRYPEKYSSVVPKVDVLYADIAQKEQSKIVLKNVEYFLKTEGMVAFSIKSRSIDVTKEPKKVYCEQVNVLESHGMEIIQIVELDPYEKDHAMVLART